MQTHTHLRRGPASGVAGGLSRIRSSLRIVTDAESAEALVRRHHGAAAGSHRLAPATFRLLGLDDLRPSLDLLLTSMAALAEVTWSAPPLLGDGLLHQHDAVVSAATTS